MNFRGPSFDTGHCSVHLEVEQDTIPLGEALRGEVVFEGGEREQHVPLVVVDARFGGTNDLRYLR